MKDLIKFLKDIDKNEIKCDYENCFIETEFNNKPYLVTIDYDYGNFLNTAYISLIWDGGEEPIWKGKEFFNFVLKNK